MITLLQVVKLLVDNGAAIDPVDLEGYTPLHLATASKTTYPDVVTILLKAGASTTHKVRDGYLLCSQ